jgi:anti-anti-sigma factor
VVVAEPAQQPELAVTYPEDGICVLAVLCDLDMQTAPTFAQLLTQELDNGCRALIVDLSGCEFLGSSGLSALVTGKDRADSSATSLVLSGLSRVAARAIEATGLDSVFTTYASTDIAISTLSRRES